MNPERLAFEQRYKEALRTHLRPDRPGDLGTAACIGREAMAAGLRMLALSKLHEQTLVMELLPACPPGGRTALCTQAAAFFAAVAVGIDKPGAGRRSEARLGKIIGSLSKRTVDLATSNRELMLDVARRKDLEHDLRKREQRHRESLAESDRLREQLRRLSRQVLSAQEDERKRISRELHDVIAQALTGINLRLANLKREADLNTKGLARNIVATQRLIAKSVKTVHEFARELRPAVLDDLGLLGMRERVEMINGRLEVESAPGKGTTISAHVPLGNGSRARRKPLMQPLDPEPQRR